MTSVLRVRTQKCPRLHLWSSIEEAGALASSRRHLPGWYINVLDRSCVSPAGAQKRGGEVAGENTSKRRSAEQRLAHCRSEFKYWYQLEGKYKLVQFLIFLPAVVTFGFYGHFLLASGYDIAHTFLILFAAFAVGSYPFLITKIMDD